MPNTERPITKSRRIPNLHAFRIRRKFVWGNRTETYARSVYSLGFPTAFGREICRLNSECNQTSTDWMKGKRLKSKLVWYSDVDYLYKTKGYWIKLIFSGLARCISLSSLGIFVYSELLHETFHPKIREAIQVQLFKLTVIVPKPDHWNPDLT